MLHLEALFDKKYLRWFHMEDGKLLVEITKIEPKVEMRVPGNPKPEFNPVLHFKVKQGKIDKVRPLVLKVTNARLIGAIHGPYPDEWIGKEIVLYVDKTMVKGKMTECVRIRSKANG